MNTSRPTCTGSCASLIEMARFKSPGHACAAFIILGRMTGYSDEDAQALSGMAVSARLLSKLQAGNGDRLSNGQMEPTRVGS